MKDLGRKAELNIVYEGIDVTKDINPSFLSVTITDNGTGKADELQLSLHDRENKWINQWFPQDNDTIEAKLLLTNWEKEGTKKEVLFGKFYVDDISTSGPPSLFNIGALSYSAEGGLKAELKSKTWEKTSLKQIATSIAKTAKLKLIFEIDDVRYENLQQNEQSDIGFLVGLCDEEGATVKITDDQLIVYDDSKLEKTKPSRTIKNGDKSIMSYTFNRSIVNANFASCTVTYKQPKKKTVTGTFTIPGLKGPNLKIQKRVENQAEAVRFARNELRKRNREANKASFVMIGNPSIVQGVTVKVEGYGKFDGHYFIETATHTISNSGYETSIQCRKVLNY